MTKLLIPLINILIIFTLVNSMQLQKRKPVRRLDLVASRRKSVIASMKMEAEKLDRKQFWFPSLKNDSKLIPAIISSNYTPRAQVRSNEIFYMVYSSYNDPNPIKLYDSNFYEDYGWQLGEPFPPGCPVVFMAHGFGGNCWTELSDINMRQKFWEKNRDIRVISMDWSTLAEMPDYIAAASNTDVAGEALAWCASSLVHTGHLRHSDIRFVGFSLGAHTCGNAGWWYNNQYNPNVNKAPVERIVALDPAGPLFSVDNKGYRLDESDAYYVHVIHTNGGLLGFFEPSGDCDIYFNGGMSQPSCGMDIIGTCSHNCAVQYYRESVASLTAHQAYESNFAIINNDGCSSSSNYLQNIVGYNSKSSNNGAYCVVT